MPFDFNHGDTCAACSLGKCFEDRRSTPVRGRRTQFRLRQQVAMNCTFGEFMPGCDTDPVPSRSFESYLSKFRTNAISAGKELFGEHFEVSSSAIAKVEGDVFELLEAGAFWNAASAWNRFMESGHWSSGTFTCPPGAIPTPTRKVAIVKLPRGYDATKLFKPEIRNRIRAHEHALQLQGMELGLSSPDIVGVRLPYPLSPHLSLFQEPVSNLNENNLRLLEFAHELLEDQIDGSGFLFAVAVKRTTRSDRLYQPLFEANILKYLIEQVLQGSAFRFYAHLNSFEGADVVGHYKAASLLSLIRGGEPSKAIDKLYLAESPRDSAQAILDDLRFFPR